MRHHGIGIFGLIVIGFLSGCQGPTDTTAQAPAGDAPPAAAAQGSHLPPAERKPRVEAPNDFGDPRGTVEGFLTALTRRNDTQVAHLLSRKAREEAAKYGQRIGAPGSDTARFEFGAVRTFDDAGAKGAEVDCTYHDHDDQGSPVSFAVTYLVRDEEGHWRVTGMKAPVPGTAATVVLNFEDFASMNANRQSAETEMRNRAAEATAANDPGTKQR